MDAPSTTTGAGAGTSVSVSPSSGVRWRRRGGAAELQFREPVRGKMWRRHMTPASVMPVARGIASWALTGIAHLTTSIAFLVGFAGAGLDLMPVWIGAIAGLAVPPAAGAIGYATGRRRQREAFERAQTIDDIASATSTAFGRDFRGVSGRQLTQRVTDAMRTGATQQARVFTPSGFVTYRIEPRGDRSVTIKPQKETPEASTFNRFVQTVPKILTAAEPRITDEADRRMAALEERLEHLEAIASIDSSHPSYPAFVILYVDRITEYRQLAAQVQAVEAVNTPEARKTAQRLVRDLDDIVDFMSTGVAEIERAILADSERQSEAHVNFMRDKYADRVAGARSTDAFGVPDARGAAGESGAAV